MRFQFMQSPRLTRIGRRGGSAIAPAPTEVWPPVATPDVYFDFDLGEGFWGGSARTVSDFIDDGGNAYRIPWGDLGLTDPNGYTMMVEVYNDATAPAASTATDLLAHKVSSSNSFTLTYRSTSQPSGYNLYGRVVHNTPVGSRDSFVWNTATMTTDQSVSEGIQRIVYSRQNGADTIVTDSLGAAVNMGIVNTNTAIPPSGNYLYINQAPSPYGNAAGIPNTSGIPIRRIAIWGSVLSTQALFETSRFDRPGILCIGDSFIAGGEFRRRFLVDIEARGKGPVAMAYNGVGSVGLTQHAARYAAMPTGFRNENLVIWDGGFETGDGIAAAKAAIDSFLSNITHDNWVLVEPNPLNAIGTPQRDTWNDFFFGAADNTGARELYHYVGADHYVKTYDVMLANGNGSPADNARIAQGLWPYNVTGDGTHPNVLGHQIAAGLVTDYAVSKSWV